MDSQSSANTFCNGRWIAEAECPKEEIAVLPPPPPPRTAAIHAAKPEDPVVGTLQNGNAIQQDVYGNEYTYRPGDEDPFFFAPPVCAVKQPVCSPTKTSTLEPEAQEDGGQTGILNVEEAKQLEQITE